MDKCERIPLTSHKKQRKQRFARNQILRCMILVHQHQLRVLLICVWHLCPKSETSHLILRSRKFRVVGGMRLR